MIIQGLMVVKKALANTDSVVVRDVLANNNTQRGTE